MTKVLLDVGNCGPDHASISRLLQSSFDVKIEQAHGAQDALEELQARTFDLVLVNRVMDRDGAEGLEIIKKIKADPRFKSLPVMMITNYAEHQQLAVEAGAEPGFGKLELNDPGTLERLGRFLG